MFTSLLTILSFRELGIGGALYYAMYKPMAERDLEKVQSLLRLYRAAYRIIGFAMFFAGLAMLPFLSYLVRGSTDLVDLRLVFVLYLLESATSYWFFAYYSAVLYTDQKNYVIALIHYVASLATMAARLVILLSLRGTPGLCFYCYSAMGVVANILKNLLVRARVRKLYPWTRDNRPILCLGRKNGRSLKTWWVRVPIRSVRPSTTASTIPSSPRTWGCRRWVYIPITWR